MSRAERANNFFGAPLFAYTGGDETENCSFHQCNEDAYLQQLKVLNSSLCDYCGETETIRHFLINCTGYGVDRNMKDDCEKLQLGFIVKSVLDDARLFGVILANINKKTSRKQETEGSRGQSSSEIRPVPALATCNNDHNDNRCTCIVKFSFIHCN